MSSIVPKTAALLLAIAAAAAASADPLWSRGGPAGGDITFLAADPQHATTIYAGTLEGGIWKTTDAAAHWKPAYAGLPIRSGNFTSINAIAVDPAVSSRVYAVTNVGLYKTDDGGTSWTESGASALEGKFLNAIAIAPSSSTTVVVGTSGGVYVSTDAGVNWKASNTGLVDGQGQTPRVLSIAIHPVASSSMIVGTNGAGAFLSTNGGQSWKKIGGTALDGIDVTGVKADPANAGNVYAFSPERGVFQLVPPSNGAGTAIARNDAAQDWEVLEAILYLWEFLVETLFCGGSPCDLWWEILFWAQFSQPSSFVSSVPFVSGSLTEILVTTSGRGIFHSLDGGKTFSPINSGLPSLAISAITGDSGSTRYAGSGLAGVAKTIDDGGHWSVSNTGLFASEVYAVAAAKSSPSIVYAATGSSVFKSSDAGVSWQNLTSIGVDQQVWPALAVDPTNPSIVYAATDEKGVVKSTNGGSSWTVSNAGIPTTGIGALAIDPASAQTVYAGTDEGLYKTVDGAAHWTLADTDLSNVHALAIDPANVQTLFAGPFQGIFRSTDAGAHWTNVSGSNGFLQTAQVQAIAIDPAAHSHVYLATSRGVWKSVDGGSSWTEIDGDIPSTFGQTNAPAIAIEPGSKIDVASVGIQVGPGNGVYRSNDGGTTWTALDAGLDDGNVAALAVSSGSSPILYAGTIGGGVFRSPAAAPPPPPGKRKIIPVHPAPPKKVRETSS
ncbi:MAG TPA: hypothetical protein VFS34_10935 [Thermoanaerobaculia bacterium]|nr:hypothetical protein [Thermoanaerobaculia bacterium]